MYRKFWLINSLGDKYDFTTKKVLLYTPQGLGFSRQYSALAVGNSEMVTSQQFKLTDIMGELLFNYDNNGINYQEYQNFIQFAKFKPLELHYQTPNELVGYHCDVIFISAEKTEISYEDKMLHVPVVFHRLTEWLTDQDNVYSFNNDPLDEGKYHDLVYDYHYSGTNLSGSPITNNGTDDVGFIIEINGNCTNPQFSLTQGGETYGICKINGTYDYVMIDSVERTESIYLELNGASITNPEQYQDFTIANGQSYLTWCKLRVGTSIFAFTCGDIENFTGTVTIKFKNSFATV